MKMQSIPANLISLLVVLISQNGFSQTAKQSAKKTNLTTLQAVVEGIKKNNKSIKNVENLNVMVDDMLVTDLHDFIIDPKHIAMVEVLVLEPKAGGEQINPSIIINTK